MNLTKLAYGALRDLGCLRAGQGTSPDILADCLDAMNEVIESWLLDELMAFTDRGDIWPLTGGVQTYTIGPTGADFIGQRPTHIEEANIILNTFNPVVRVPMKIIETDQWAAIRVQDIPFAIPRKLYYEKDFNQPQGFATIHVWPGPLASYGLELYTWQQLQLFADLTTDYNFPPGYVRAMRKTLAVEIAPMMMIHGKLGRLAQPQQPMIELVAAQARDAVEKIQSDNAPSPAQLCDPAFTGGSTRGAFNYAIGES